MMMEIIQDIFQDIWKFVYDYLIYWSYLFWFVYIIIVFLIAIGIFIVVPIILHARVYSKFLRSLSSRSCNRSNNYLDDVKECFEDCCCCSDCSCLGGINLLYAIYINCGFVYVYWIFSTICFRYFIPFLIHFCKDYRILTDGVLDNPVYLIVQLTNMCLTITILIHIIVKIMLCCTIEETEKEDEKNEQEKEKEVLISDINSGNSNGSDGNGAKNVVIAQTV